MYVCVYIYIYIYIYIYTHVYTPPGGSASSCTPPAPYMGILPFNFTKYNFKQTRSFQTAHCFLPLWQYMCLSINS